MSPHLTALLIFLLPPSPLLPPLRVLCLRCVRGICRYNAGLALSAFRVLGVITVLLTCVRPHFSAPHLTVLKVPASKPLAGVSSGSARFGIGPQPEARWGAILVLFTALVTLGCGNLDIILAPFLTFHPLGTALEARVV